MPNDTMIDASTNSSARRGILGGICDFMYYRLVSSLRHEWFLLAKLPETWQKKIYDKKNRTPKTTLVPLYEGAQLVPKAGVARDRDQ